LPGFVELHANHTPPLDDRAVHVWRVPLRLPPSRMRWAEGMLDADERERAVRFRFAEHHDAFVAGRAIQRDLLARYAAVEPAEVRYRLAAHGKPKLTGPAASRGLRFNFSNADALGLLAVAVGRELGVDLEPLRPIPDGVDIASRFFSESEVRVLRSLDAGVRDEAFLRCWTRKEAYIKAVGGGLSIALDGFDVAFAPGEEARLLRHRDDPAEALRWTMRGLDPGPGYVAALAVEGDGWTLEHYDWRP
jgi:4'-phosphopantetheinyl transferase